MTTEEFKLLLNNIDDKYIDKAGEALDRYHEYVAEGSCVEASPVPRRRGHIAAIVCAAAVLVVACAAVLNIGRIKNSASSATGKENYLGGTGEFRGNYYLEDDRNIYIPDTEKKLLLKFDKITEELSVACQAEGCAHDSDSCKASLMNNTSYCSFGGRLIKNRCEDEPSDSGVYRGSLYLCGGSEKQVFKYEFPEGADNEELVNMSSAIGSVYALDSEHLAVVSPACAYILDKDFRIQHTITDFGPYSSGIYCVDDIIYYISDQYKLKEIDPASGRHYVYDLDSRKIKEGVLVGDTLWFRDEDKRICCLDFTKGEVHGIPYNGVRIGTAGKYITFFDQDLEGMNFLDSESAYIVWFRDGLEGTENAPFFANEKYYDYNNGILSEYSAVWKQAEHIYYIGGKV